MTVGSENVKIQHTGNGVVTNFSYNFTIENADHLEVILVDTTVDPVTEKVLVKDTDYTVNGVGVAGGGSIDTIGVDSPLSSDIRLTIKRSMPKTQDLDLGYQSNYSGELTEDKYDELVYMIQDQEEVLGRCAKSKLGDTKTGDDIIDDILEAEINAAASAAAAASSASDSSTSAAAALVSEGNAAASETAAGISETNAAASEAAAAASAAAAAGEVATHAALTNGTHGVTGEFVGTTDAQTVENKSTTVLQMLATTGVPYAEGKLFYDSLTNTLSYYSNVSGVTINIGKEMVTDVRNNTGATLLDGKVIYQTGAVGSKPTIALADASSLSTSSVIAVMTHDLLNNANGLATSVGLVNGIDTSAFTDGDTVYLSATTPGELTATIPAFPNVAIRVGFILYAHVTNGILLVNIERQEGSNFQDNSIFYSKGGRPYEDNADFSYNDTTKVLGVNTIDTENAIIAKEIATPANPTAGDNKLYFKTDGDLYKLDSAGVEEKLSAGATADNDELNNQLHNLGLATSVAASALTVELKQKDGTSAPTTGTPVNVSFRNSTITTGGFVSRSVTAAMSLIVPSGATLGMADATEQRLWVYALDNAGTVELAICGVKLNEAKLYTTVALSAASDDIGVLYSTTLRTDVPIRLIGWLESTQATAGTWVSSPSALFAGVVHEDEKCLFCVTDTSGQLVSADAEYSIGWNITETDTHNSFNGSGYVVPKDGHVTALATIKIDSALAPGDFSEIYFKVNGVSKRRQSTPSDAGSSMQPKVNISNYPVAKGDIITIGVYQTGPAFNMNTSSASYHNFSGEVK